MPVYSEQSSITIIMILDLNRKKVYNIIRDHSISSIILECHCIILDLKYHFDILIDLKYHFDILLEKAICYVLSILRSSKRVLFGELMQLDDTTGH